MGKVIKSSNQIKIGVVLGYVNFAAKLAIQLLYVPLMLRLLGQSEYGVYQLVGSLIAYLSLLNFGFGSSYMRFYSQSKDSREKEAELNGTYLMVFLLFALLALIVGSFITINSQTILGSKLTAEELKLAKILLAILTVNMALTFPNSVFTSVITSRECFLYQRLLDLFVTIANPFLSIILLLLGYGSVGMVFVTTAFTVFSIILNVWYIAKKIKAEFSFKRFNVNLVKEVAVFSFFIFLNSIIDQINWNVDKYLLARFVGSIAVAVYSVGGQINSIFIQITDMIANVLVPRINRIVAEKEQPLPELNDLFKRVGRLQSIIVFAVVTGFIVYGKEFIGYWAGKGYEEAYAVTLLLIIPVSIPLCQTLGVDIQRALNKHQYRSYVYAGVAFLNLLVSIPLTYRFGVIGAASGTAIALILGNGIAMNIMYQKIIGLDVKSFWKQICSVFPSVIPSLIISLILKRVFPIQSVFDLIIQIIIFMIIYAGALFLYGFNKQEKDTAASILKKIFAK